MTKIFEGEYFLSHTTVVGLNRFAFCRTELSCESQSQFFSQAYNRKNQRVKKRLLSMCGGRFCLVFSTYFFII